ncbi:MAG: recombinase XerD, partial [Pirellulales bacterium]
MSSVYKRGGSKNRGGSYYVSWRDENGKRRVKSAKTTDKATAKRIAAKLEADVALRSHGVIDRSTEVTERESKRPVDSHLSDFDSKLRAAGRTDRYVTETIAYIRRLIEAGGWETISNICAEDVTHYARGLQDKGRSSRTVQAHLAAVKAFTKCLASRGKLSTDPLADCKKPNPKADRRFRRRILLPE